MLSKEEKESSFKIIETICDEEICLFNKTIVQGNVNQIKRHIDQLESDKQKLIEKLEKILKEYENVIANEESAMNLYAEILEIVKGVENES